MVRLTSFIGVDGTNTTLNSGRFLIKLKPQDERSLSASQIIRRCNSEVAGVPGITLYMQPVQDLTIEYHRQPHAVPVRAGGREPDRVHDLGAEADATAAGNGRSWRMWRATCRRRDQALDIDIDRATAARFGITPATVDNALYDAFGQRIVSTIFTQSNQYRVIMEVDPAVQTSLAGCRRSTCRPRQPPAGRCRCRPSCKLEQRSGPLLITHFGQFPATTISFNLAPGASLGAAVQAIQQTPKKMSACRKASSPPSRVRRWRSSPRCPTRCCCCWPRWSTMYIVLGVLYESFIHPITILSTLPSAGVGALLALMLAGDDLDVIAIIGIVLLIGIVKKNAIMMIDFALEAEREEGKPPRAGDLSRPACCASGRS